MLKSFELNTTDFIKILDSYFCYTQEVTDLNPYKAGYREKQIIYYTQDALIVCENRLKYLGLMNPDEEYTYWKQVIIVRSEKTTAKYVQPDITGLYSLLTVRKNLYKYYNKGEVNKILSSYNNEYDYNKKQYHIINLKSGLSVYKNCVGYDINGAHNDALVQMFPKAKDYFIKMFNERHDKPENKKIINYFCGMLNCKDLFGNYKYYPAAYNWIVQRTTDNLLKGLAKATGKSGLTIYANTDGFIVQNSDKELEVSNKLGEFKQEMKGDVYSYVDKNYWCIQYIDSKGEKVLKGNVLNSVRDKIDLFKGQIVHYKKFKNQFGITEAKDIEIEIIKETKIYD
jgi:hypothetical protein